MTEQGTDEGQDRVREGGSTAADETSSQDRDVTPDEERDLTGEDSRDERDGDRDDRDDSRDTDTDVTPDEPTTADDAPRMQGGDDSDEDADAAKGDQDPRDVESDEERREREEAFAAEHDPEQHDIAAGEEVRQPGDWTAEDASGPQVWDAEGNLVEGEHPGEPTGTAGGSGSGSDSGSDGRRVSGLDEIRDGGYGVGSAAPFDDGAQPLDHDVKAWEDTKTYLCSGEQGYDGVDPDVWFYDDFAAEQAGFRHAD